MKMTNAEGFKVVTAELVQDMMAPLGIDELTSMKATTAGMYEEFQTVTEQLVGWSLEKDRARQTKSICRQYEGGEAESRTVVNLEVKPQISKATMDWCLMRKWGPQHRLTITAPFRYRGDGEPLRRRLSWHAMKDGGDGSPYAPWLRVEFDEENLRTGEHLKADFDVRRLRADQKRVFGFGIQVLRAFDPDMLKSV